MSGDTPSSDGWAISFGPSMSGVVPQGAPGEGPPVITAILPDGEELTADDQGVFTHDLPPRTRIFIGGQLAATVPFQEEQEDGFFNSPEEAAVASFPSDAQARILSVELSGDEAVVVVDTEPSHPVSLRCERREHGWECRGMQASA